MSNQEKGTEKTSSYEEYVAEEIKEQSYKYITPTPGKFPIIADTPIPYEFFPAKKSYTNATELEEKLENLKSRINEIYQGIMDCGFNAVMYGGGKNGDDVLDFFLRTIEKFELAVILNPQWLPAHDDPHSSVTNKEFENQKYEQYIKYCGSKSVKALQICDEPDYSRWQTDDTFMMRLYKGLVEWISKDQANQMVYFNLAAGEGEGLIGPGTGCYKGYLSILEALFRLPVWSYDVYPFKAIAVTGKDWDTDWMSTAMPDSTGSNPDLPSVTNTYIEYAHFFKYLEIFRNRAQRTGRPFWAFAMSIGHKQYGWKNDEKDTEWILKRYQPAPTVGMLRFEIFCALAYGAQGIVYWTYGQHSIDHDEVHPSYNFGDAPLSWRVIYTTTGSKVDILKKTDIWYCCQRVNQEIALYSDVFLGCEVVEIGIGSTKFNGWGGNPQSAVFPMGCIKQIITSDKILVSHLQNGNNNYMVIVNLNPFVEIKYRTQVFLDDNYTYNFMTQWEGEKVTRSNNAYQKFEKSFLDIHLPAGGFYIISWK